MNQDKEREAPSIMRCFGICYLKPYQRIRRHTRTASFFIRVDFYLDVQKQIVRLLKKISFINLMYFN